MVMQMAAAPSYVTCHGLEVAVAAARMIDKYDTAAHCLILAPKASTPSRHQ